MSLINLVLLLGHIRREDASMLGMVLHAVLSDPGEILQAKR
jgi:hypothetical protein